MFTGLANTLPNSLDFLDQSLLQIEGRTSELRNQGAPDKQLNEIIVRICGNLEKKEATMVSLNSIIDKDKTGKKIIELLNLNCLLSWYYRNNKKNNVRHSMTFDKNMK